MPLAFLLTLVLCFLAPDVWWLQVGLWLGTAAHQLYLFYLVVAWRVDKLIVTDRRLIRVSGVFTTRIDAVTLAKITDTSYRQSLLGHLFSYGSLRIETPGQTQALEQLDFMPSPAEIYRAALP